MSEELTIRLAKREEAPKILEFIKDFAKYEKMSKLVTLNEEDIITNIFDKGYARVLFLEVEERVIGFAIYFYSFSTFIGKSVLYLEDLFIENGMRGKGYGKEVLAYLAKTAKVKDCIRFEWSCLRWNKPSIAIYEKMKATQMREWIKFRLDGKELDELAGKCDKEIDAYHK
ncbi:MAG: GNAT family N-acetyltransferase [Candidatus Izimaplasma sp.]|nr:GNAT family N-acetyltransferase [Candidatus Izimaplasma bacterium]